jgi:hypothetical protein
MYRRTGFRSRLPLFVMKEGDRFVTYRVTRR